MTDEELLNWAESHPEAVIDAISVNWTTCGAGCREQFFNFRMCIKDAMKKEAQA